MKNHRFSQILILLLITSSSNNLLSFSYSDYISLWIPSRDTLANLANYLLRTRRFLPSQQTAFSWAHTMHYLGLPPEQRASALRQLLITTNYPSLITLHQYDSKVQKQIRSERKAQNEITSKIIKDEIIDKINKKQEEHSLKTLEDLDNFKRDTLPDEKTKYLTSEDMQEIRRAIENLRNQLKEIEASDNPTLKDFDTDLLNSLKDDQKPS